jgi:GAF domain-containing protein
MSHDTSDGTSDKTVERPVAGVDTMARLASQLSEAAHSWEAEGSLEDTLIAIALSAVETVPGADYAGVSLIRSPHTITTPAATDDLVREADAIQAALGEGPCVEALWERRTVRVDDLATDARWPTFGPRAVALGVVSMLAFRLFTAGDSWGALNLYSRKKGAFDDASEFAGQLFASHASIALAGSQEITQLTAELASRDFVGKATGILMERHRINADAAHEMLLATSRSSRMSLRDVAEWLVKTPPGPALGSSQAAHPAANGAQAKA